MAENTRGKGPFARRTRPSPPNYRAPRWHAPPMDLSEPNIRKLLDYIELRNDTGVTVFMRGLAVMEPHVRLARNLCSLIRLMAAKEVDDVLRDGFSDVENRTLIQLESWGIPADLLGVAHALLNVRERRELAVHFGHSFVGAKAEKGYQIENE